METAIRKATRLDYNPPKQKHLQTLIGLTYQSPGNTATIIDMLERRLKENSWIITFKVLIIIHTVMRHGEGEKAVAYIVTRPSALDTSRIREKSSGVGHIQNIYDYTAYLKNKVISYRQLKLDHIKQTMNGRVGRLRHLSVKSGLLKETVVLQKQMGSLLKCKFILDDVDNNISLYAFRLLVEDLLILFQIINEAIVNILEHYFAMNKTDARASLDIYKMFAKQTEETISYLDRARRYEYDLNISIPKVKHAPLSLATALQEYLDDAEKNSSNISQQQRTATTTTASKTNVSNVTTPTASMISSAQQQQQPKELTDFFASLQSDTSNSFYNPATAIQHQQPMLGPINAQQTGCYNNTSQLMNAFNSQMGMPQQAASQQAFFSPSVASQPTIGFGTFDNHSSTFSPATSLSTGSSSNPFRSKTIEPSSTASMSLVPSSTSSTTITQNHNYFLNNKSNLTSLQSNPFRSSTMPGMNTATTSTFATTIPSFSNTSTQQPITNINSTSSKSNNPFTSNSSSLNRAATIAIASPQPPLTNSSNPFSNNKGQAMLGNQQQQQQQQQQLQPWGNNSVF